MFVFQFGISILIDFSYFINHYTKTTSWEDPRVRYQQIGKSSNASTTSGVTNKENKPENESSSSQIQVGIF